VTTFVACVCHVLSLSEEYKEFSQSQITEKMTKDFSSYFETAWYCSYHTFAACVACTLVSCQDGHSCIQDLRVLFVMYATALDTHTYTYTHTHTRYAFGWYTTWPHSCLFAALFILQCLTLCGRFVRYPLLGRLASWFTGEDGWLQISRTNWGSCNCLCSSLHRYVTAINSGSISPWT
jgi:hypothetical protein